MRTLRNATGTKAVNISTDGQGLVNAFYVQGEQLLEAKTYSTVKRAEKWARKVLA